MRTAPIRLAAFLAAILLITLGPAEGSGRAAAAPIPQPAEVVTVEVRADRSSVLSGDQLPVAVILDHAEGWHVHTNDPKIPASWGEFEAIPTSIAIKSIKGARAGPVQWPVPVEIPLDLAGTGNADPYGVFEGRAIAYVPLIVDQRATGDVSVELIISFQACDDTTCVQPETVTRTITLPVGAGPRGAAVATGADLDFRGFDPSIFSDMLSGKVVELATFDFIGYRFQVGRTAYWLIFLLAFIAGFLLNLTPCVLAVLPLKVLSLQQQAGSPAKLTLFGAVYCLGIVATFLVLGLLIFGVLTGGEKQDWGQIYSNRWFVITMAAIVGIMGIGLMGLFTIPLPQAVYNLSPSHDSVHGNFFMGALTAVLSTPCTGPLLAATIAWAATQPPWLGLVTFIIMGCGMASPYVALIARPKLLDRLPRSGPGGEVLKQVLGVLLLAVAAYVASNLTTDKWTWWIVGSFFALACLWAIVQSLRMLRSVKAKRIVVVVATLALAGGVYATALLADEGPIPWRKFANVSDDTIANSIDAELAEGRIVVIDFTAKWCTNCLVIEETILNSDDGVALLNAEGVVPMKVDLSNADSDRGWGMVKGISGGGGIPLIAVYRPGQSQPTFFTSFFGVSDLAGAMGMPIPGPVAPAPR